MGSKFDRKYNAGFLLAIILSSQHHSVSWFASSFSLSKPSSRISNQQMKMYVSDNSGPNAAPVAKKRSRLSRLQRPRFGRTKKDIGSSTSGVPMVFTGERKVKTSPVSIQDDVSVLNEFFSNNEFRGLLFPDNNAKCLERTLSDDLYTKWCNEAVISGASGPEVKAVNQNDDSVFELLNTDIEKVEMMKITALLNMPSLQIRSESIIGTKLLLGGNGRCTKNFPELQFTLLDSQLHLEGSKAAKFIFNQIIKFLDSTSSFTRVTLESTSEGAVFTTAARLGINIRIPSLKFLPSANVGKFEQQGSQSIQNLLEKDLEPALISFRDAYEIFAQEKIVANEILLLKP